VGQQAAMRAISRLIALRIAGGGGLDVGDVRNSDPTFAVAYLGSTFEFVHEHAFRLSEHLLIIPDRLV
jgi:hypothetical protein